MLGNTPFKAAFPWERQLPQRQPIESPMLGNKPYQASFPWERQSPMQQPRPQQPPLGSVPFQASFPWERQSPYATQLQQTQQMQQQPQMPQMPQNRPVFQGERIDRPRGQFLGNEGAGLLNQIAMGQLGNFFGAGQRVADSVNSGYDILQRSMTNAADRRERGQELRSRERMVSMLAKALLGGGSGGGIRDTNSPLQVGGNSVSTNITAQPLSMADIIRADDAVRNTPMQNTDPVRGPFPGAQGELNQLLQGRLREIAPNVERGLTNVNSPFARQIQATRGQQFQGLGGLLAALQGDQIGRQGQNVRTLMQLVGG